MAYTVVDDKLRIGRFRPHALSNGVEFDSGQQEPLEIEFLAVSVDKY